MNRRTFMMTSAWLPTVTGGAWSMRVLRAASRSNTLAIVDRSLTCGPAFAYYAACLKLPIFETGDDVGALWYTTLAPRLTPRSSVIGVTRASDYFVLHELAARAGLRTANISARDTRSAKEHTHTVFTFTPRVFVRRLA
jgi:hypothetical protein